LPRAEALSLAMALVAGLAAMAGRILWPWTFVLITMAKISFAGLIVILAFIGVTLLFRALRAALS
jgi:hypothetical protein